MGLMSRVRNLQPSSGASLLKRALAMRAKIEQANGVGSGYGSSPSSGLRGRSKAAVLDDVKKKPSKQYCLAAA